MFAQTTAPEALDVFESWWLYVAPLLPFVQAFLIKANSGKWAKIILSVGFATVLAALSLVQADWSAPTIELVVLRLGTAWTIGQLVYKAASAKLGGQDQSINDIILPGFGIRIGRARELVEAKVGDVRNALG